PTTNCVSGERDSKVTWPVPIRSPETWADPSRVKTDWTRMDLPNPNVVINVGRPGRPWPSRELTSTPSESFAPFLDCPCQSAVMARYLAVCQWGVALVATTSMHTPQVTVGSK